MVLHQVPPAEVLGLLKRVQGFGFRLPGTRKVRSIELGCVLNFFPCDSHPTPQEDPKSSTPIS